MRVLVHQQYHLGHHYQYVRHLLPGLIELGDEVIVTITSEGAQSVEFRNLLQPFASKVKFLSILPTARPWVPLSERLRMHRVMREAIRVVRPDYVLVPSGDAQATAAGFFRLASMGNTPGRVPCEVGIHLGSGSGGVGLRSRLRSALHLANLAAGGFARIHVMNALFYEEAIARRGSLARSVRLMPHPVSFSTDRTKRESRHFLGIPEDGRYIGLAASLDSRKAIPEFLAAFRAASPRPEERVILAGWMNGTHQRTIERSFADLIGSGQLILRSDFLDQETFEAVLTALDVVCTPYPHFAGLSSTLLEAVAANRPVLANDFGWSRAIVRRFDLGWTCDVLDHEVFAKAVRTALDQCDSPRDSEARTRLLAFHSPENFVNSWLHGLRETRRLHPSTDIRSWHWVSEAVPVPLRHAL